MTYALTLGPVCDYLALPRLPQIALLADHETDAAHLRRLIMDVPQVRQSPPPDPELIAQTTANAIGALREIVSGDPSLDSLFYFQTRIGPKHRTSYVLDGILNGEHLIYTARIPGDLDGDEVSGVRVTWPVADSGIMSLFGDPRELGDNMRRRGMCELADLTDRLLAVEEIFAAAEIVDEWSRGAP